MSFLLPLVFFPPLHLLTPLFSHSPPPYKHAPGARGTALGSVLGLGLGGGLKGLEVTVEALIKKLEAEQESPPPGR
jgi:hypothetical protein